MGGRWPAGRCSTGKRRACHSSMPRPALASLRAAASHTSSGLSLRAASHLEKGRIVILKKVFFATNKDKILKKSFPVLRAVAGILRANPQVTEIRIEGHTDDVGKDADNMDLSKRRAKSVKKFLVDKEKIDAKRLVDAGYGETVPLCKDVPALSKTKKLKRRNRRKIKACRATNRRVEFLVTGVNGKPVNTTTIKTK